MPAAITVIEGIDGGGKTTAVRAVTQFYEERLRLKPFDTQPFEERLHRLPSIDELGPDVCILITNEPTYSGTGAEIRRELHLDTDDPIAEAERFAEDRRRLHLELIIPYFSASGQRVICSRGILSSLVYQAPRVSTCLSMSLDDAVGRLAQMPGNELELAWAPELILILDLDSEEAARRLQRSRGGSLDRFERDLAFQRRIRELYHHPVIQAPLLAQGTTFVTIDTNGTVEATRQHVLDALTRFHAEKATIVPGRKTALQHMQGFFVITVTRRLIQTPLLHAHPSVEPL